MELRDYLALPGNSQQKLADKMGLSQSLISQHLRWLEDRSRGRDENAVKVSFDRMLEFERATDGMVTRHDLLPEIFGPAPTDKAA